MIDIFSIPLYYIGFKKNSELEKNLTDIGFKEIHHFPAINGRKLNPKQLLKDNIIGPRAYNDLVYGRDQHTGISSLGTIGCTMSHLKLWKLCAENLPYIIIAEDDLVPHELSKNDIENIQKALEKPKGGFISAKFKKGDELLLGLHFYFLTNEAAKQLYKKSTPIDMQTDSFVGNLNNIGDINIDGYNIGHQRIRKSSTGDKCIKCFLPKGPLFYIIVVIGIMLLILLVILLYIKFIHVKTELDSCRSSQLDN